MSALTTHSHEVTKEKRKEKKQIKGNSNKRSKAKERQGARSLEEDKSRTLLTVNFRQPRVLVIHWFRL
jgi:hypothetical protein